MSFTSMEVPYEDPAIYVRHGLYIVQTTLRNLQYCIAAVVWSASRKARRGRAHCHGLELGLGCVPCGAAATGTSVLRRILGIRTVLPGGVYVRVLSGVQLAKPATWKYPSRWCSYAARRASSLKSRMKSMMVGSDRAVAIASITASYSACGAVSARRSGETRSMWGFVCAGEICGRVEDRKTEGRLSWERIVQASVVLFADLQLCGHSILPMGCYSSLLAPAAPGPSRLWLVIASDPVAATEGEGSMEAALHKESDSLGPPLAIQENIIVTSDVPSQPPPSPSVTDVAIAGPSRSSLGEEQTGDRPPYPLHSQYDIV
ncbi:hypothetical protein H4582DRAFT_2062849 [Lactarius indigo]|nr:hypothetical protein H4582DRAFT_2062849 [Lactarius indigo]